MSVLCFGQMYTRVYISMLCVHAGAAHTRTHTHTQTYTRIQHTITPTWSTAQVFAAVHGINGIETT